MARARHYLSKGATGKCFKLVKLISKNTFSILSYTRIENKVLSAGYRIKDDKFTISQFLSKPEYGYTQFTEVSKETAEIYEGIFFNYLESINKPLKRPKRKS